MPDIHVHLQDAGRRDLVILNGPADNNIDMALAMTLGVAHVRIVNTSPPAPPVPEVTSVIQFLQFESGRAGCYAERTILQLAADVLADKMEHC